MSFDRSWMQRRVRVDGPGVTPEFRRGVTDFLDFAFAHPKFVDEDKIRCPCRICELLHYRTRDEVNVHLFRKGFVNNYTRWTQHGESSMVKRVDVADVGTNPDKEMVTDAAGLDYTWDDNFNDEYTEEPNKKAQKFYDTLKDADEQLWEGCKKHTRLSAVTQLLHLKSDCGWSDQGFNRLLKLVKQFLPEDEKLPESYYQAKKMVKKLGLGYEKIQPVELNRSPTQLEFIETAHKKSGWESVKDGQKAIADKYTSKLSQGAVSSGGSTAQPFDELDAWVESSGGMKKGRVVSYGARERASDISGASSSSRVQSSRAWSQAEAAQAERAQFEAALRADISQEVWASEDFRKTVDEKVDASVRKALLRMGYTVPPLPP